MAKKAKKKKKTTWQKHRQTILLTGFIVLILAIVLLVNPVTKWWQARDDITYNSFVFRPTDGYWVTSVYVNNQPYTIPFHYNPAQVDMIPMQQEAKTLITRRPKGVFITTNPEYPSNAVVGGVEIAKVLGERNGIFNIPTRAALTTGTGNQTPVVTCNQATNETIVIEIRLGLDDKIFTEGNCIIVQGATGDDLVKSSDRFVYGLLGIIG
ncbi:MAG: hypothetical protein ABIA93_07620 [Candidatus Woesearchaeota archaeon]